jgi:2-methylcitrate dehydratase PrpD
MQKNSGSFTPELNDSHDNGLTHHVASFIQSTSYKDIPKDVIETSKKSILDGIGLSIAGLKSHAGQLALQFISNQAPINAPCTVIGGKDKTSMRLAAFINGLTMHADDYDDTQLAVKSDRVYGLLTHPTAPCLPAVLAVAECKKSVTGKDFLLAYNLGIEVETKIAEAISPRHYQQGFHATGTCGVFASATAASKLAALPIEKILTCLSIAGSQAAGLRENFGTMTKPFHAGRAAEAGINALELTELGWTASANILEAPRGFFQAHGGSYAPDSILNVLANPWTFNNPGVSIKPHPSGSLTHPAMTALSHLININSIKSSGIKRILVGTNHNMPNALIHHDPKNEYQAKFSMEYCMAIIALKGKAGLNEFQDEMVKTDEVKEMLKKVTFYVDPIAEQKGYDKMTSIIKLELMDGRSYTKTLDFGKGSPENPMSYTEVSDKFKECTSFANWSNKKTYLIIDIIKDLENLTNLSDLVWALKDYE